jgi:hypothetical protein
VPQVARDRRAYAKRQCSLTALGSPSCGVTPMNMHERFAAADEMFAGARESPRSSWLGLMRIRLAAWAKTCANHYAAAAAYDDLSHLSDTQLKHRGLSRDILARDLSAWRE